MMLYENLHKINKEFETELRQSFDDLLNSGNYILGNNVKQFEFDFAQYCKVKHCIGVASGLDALMLALKSFDFDTNSEIIVPSNTYIATILAVINAGLKPILAEPNINTYNIDPIEIEKKINSKTKAIIIVHLYGKCCNMEPIVELCKRYNLKLIEDCAQAHGAVYKDNYAGSFGDIGCFSFYPTKNLGALGDGGAIITNSDDIANKLIKLRNYGSDKKNLHEVVGFNSRLDEIQAGFLSVKLQYLNGLNRTRINNAKIYNDTINDNFIKPLYSNNRSHVYHIYNIRHPNRDKLLRYLIDNGVYALIHYPISPNLQPSMKYHLANQPCPISEEIHNTTISLPISSSVPKSSINKVAEILNKFKG